METLQPKLRFPEFDGNWVRKILKKTCIINPSNKKLPKKFIYIDLESVNNGMLHKENEILLDDAPSRAQRFLNKEDVLFQMVRPYQKNNFYFDKEGDYVASTGYAQLRANESSKFLFQYMHNQSFVDRVIEKCTGSNYPAINSTDLANIFVVFPENNEQTKIANFLFSIDGKLNLLKEKKELLEDYKKGIMQKIFNQEIRFKDDKGNDFEDWKASILSDVVNLFHGYQFRTSDFTSKGIAVIKISNVIGNNLDLNNLTFIKKERFEDFKNFEIQNDDILMSLTGNIGRIIEVKDKPFFLLQNYRVGKFIPLDENVINKPFLKYLLASNLVFGRFSQLANQSAQANFGKQDMDKINISYPTIDEQTKIANFLSAIDEKIELVSNQIQDTQEYKKGLLQRMFV